MLEEARNSDVRNSEYEEKGMKIQTKKTAPPKKGVKKAASREKSIKEAPLKKKEPKKGALKEEKAIKKAIRKETPTKSMKKEEKPKEEKKLKAEVREERAEKWLEREEILAKEESVEREEKREQEEKPMAVAEAPAPKEEQPPKPLTEIQKPFLVEDSDFHSLGQKCVGKLYRPGGVARPPVIIMAHGFAAEMAFGLPAFAERFVAEGMAVFMFDYRYFGKSEGLPRNFVSPKDHIKDWQAAIAHVRALPNVDGQRIALWGSSFSGGHVIKVAAADHGVKAIVAQVPFVDGGSTARRTGFGHALFGVGACIRDLLQTAVGLGPHYVPVFASQDTFAVMNTQESLPGYLALIPKDSEWENRCPARIFLPLAMYRPIAVAHEVECPALLISGKMDSLIDPLAVDKTAALMPKSTLVTLPVGHFDVYRGKWFDEVVKKETEFLKKHLTA